jgi:hypothetical protein
VKDVLELEEWSPSARRVEQRRFKEHALARNVGFFVILARHFRELFIVEFHFDQSESVVSVNGIFVRMRVPDDIDSEALASPQFGSDL